MPQWGEWRKQLKTHSFDFQAKYTRFDKSCIINSQAGTKISVRFLPRRIVVVDEIDQLRGNRPNSLSQHAGIPPTRSSRRRVTACGDTLYCSNPCKPDDVLQELFSFFSNRRSHLLLIGVIGVAMGCNYCTIGYLSHFHSIHTCRVSEAVWHRNFESMILVDTCIVFEVFPKSVSVVSYLFWFFSLCHSYCQLGSHGIEYFQPLFFRWQ